MLISHNPALCVSNWNKRCWLHGLFTAAQPWWMTWENCWMFSRLKANIHIYSHAERIHTCARTHIHVCMQFSLISSLNLCQVGNGFHDARAFMSFGSMKKQYFVWMRGNVNMWISHTCPPNTATHTHSVHKFLDFVRICNPPNRNTTPEGKTHVNVTHNANMMTFGCDNHVRKQTDPGKNAAAVSH